MEWFRVVLDEAHWIHNQGSQQFQAVDDVPSQRRWCMTGTPIQNRIDDLVSLLRFLRFEPLCRGATFQKHIMEPLSKDDTDRTKALHVLLRGVCLRRDESYLNLPDLVHKAVDIRFEAREKELYDGVLKTCQRDLDDVVSGQSKAKKYAVLLAAIMKLRRLCNHGTLLTSETIANSEPTAPGLLESCEYCQENQEESLAVINKDKMLLREQIPYLSIDGRISYKERPSILQQFRTDDRIPILLMSIQTGAVGLNLTAANFIHIVEPQWNPSVEEQAIGRALRLGQTRTVTVFRYVMQSSIEQNIQTLQKKKRNLAKFTLDGSGTENGTLEDFKFMLDM
ncbi:hypothetical protein LQW54_000142 [Pestalotiopsis sp. IQ-011]